MKSRLFLIIATLVGLGSMVTSCSQDDDLVVATDGDQKEPISFNVNICSLPDPEVSTRGYSNPASDGHFYFRNTDVVSIAICGVSGSSRPTGESNEVIKNYNAVTVNASTPVDASTATDLTYSADADGNTTYKFDWLGPSEKISLRAWSYGDASTPATDPNGATFTLQQDQTVDVISDNTKNIKELLYAPALRYDKGSITIPLYHQLSRIVVNVKSTLATATNGSTITINSLNIGDSNMPTSATFARPTGDTYANAWTYAQASTTASGYNDTDANKEANLYGRWSGHTGTGTINAKKWASPTATYTATFSAVILPYKFTSATKFIVITTSNGTYSYSIAANTEFKAGYQYTFNITDLNQIDFNVTVSAWGADTNVPLTFSN